MNTLCEIRVCRARRRTRRAWMTRVGCSGRQSNLHSDGGCAGEGSPEYPPSWAVSRSLFFSLSSSLSPSLSLSHTHTPSLALSPSLSVYLSVYPSLFLTRTKTKLSLSPLLKVADSLSRSLSHTHSLSLPHFLAA